MADAFTAPASRFHVIPDSLSDAQAALVEPLSTAVHAVRMAGPLAGAAVAVLGGGTIGLLTLTAAVRAGARAVAVSEPRDSKRQRVRRRSLSLPVRCQAQSRLNRGSRFGLDALS